ncbi:DUF4760 domain-containing protein [Antrihabitans spumae]|uniref:Transposase n=1 Tax=Antrihabitans spumae TaxID=3373370 RepID=A0ABW7K7S0_9NOCA
MPALLLRWKDEGEVGVLVQEQLNALETLACGARLQVYDVNIIFHMQRNIIKQLWVRTATLREAHHDGRHEDKRAAQPTAYEHADWLVAQFAEKSGEGAILLDGTLTGT